MIVLVNKKYNSVKNITNSENLLLEYKKKFKGHRKLIYWFSSDLKPTHVSFNNV